MDDPGPRVFTIAADKPFLQVLASAVLAGFPKQHPEKSDAFGLARWTILVPTRRAARELEDIFFARAGSAGLLLPKIKPIGDIDEDLLRSDDAAASDLAQDLPRAVSRPGQLLLLIDLIDDWAKANPQTRLAQEIAAAPHQAHGLAVTLAEFLDGLETEEIDMARIPELYDLESARHREAILEFLSIAREAYPTRLRDAGLIGPQERRSLILRREAARLLATRTDAPFIVAGSTGTIQATRALLAAIAGLPNGAVVLPGLDLGMDDASWQATGPTHPQHALKQLLTALHVTRDHVRELDDVPASPRSWLAGETMRPAETAHLWRDSLAGRAGDVQAAMHGVELIEARSIPEEALTTALILRHCLETPGRTACLVTPDRQLARRVKSELQRWNIDIDDSAGEPLLRHGGASLFNLLLEAMLQGFTSETLAPLLHHQLSTFGASTGQARRATGILELALLRTGTGTPDIAALAHALRTASEHDGYAHLLVRSITPEEWQFAIGHAARISAVLAPLRVDQPGTLSGHLDRLIAAAEAMAGEALWAGEAGELLRGACDMLKDESALLRHCSLMRAANIIRHWLQSIPLRMRVDGPAPLAILGLLEARLMRPDLIVLAGLNEGVWPGSPDPGPWLNRPMRDILAMSQPEREIGQTAHDFIQAFGCNEVKLIWSRRAGDAPATPSRWILRLQMILKTAGLNNSLGATSPWVDMVRQLTEPGKVTPLGKPKPRPALALRPGQLSVTRIETLIRDPYAIYARHILRLQPLDPIAAVPDPARRGMIFHGAIGDFLNAYPVESPPDAEARLLEFGKTRFEEISDYQELVSFWWPRFAGIAHWLAGQEPGLRQNVERVAAEIAGALELTIAGETFTLTCRADRIDLFAGGAARISDYKTGATPSAKEVEVGLAPQLTLQAAMLEAGAFPDIGPRATDALFYIKLSGGEVAGEIKPLKFDDSVMDVAHRHLAGLKTILLAYADPKQPYLPRTIMKKEDDAGDYDHLSRFREWALSGGGS